jgi:ATP-binding cassette subfamily F protein 3
VATTVIEVKDGRVTNYLGDYAAYLAGIEREIDDAEAADRPTKSAGPARPAARGGSGRRGEPDDRDVRKEIAAVEKAIARIDAEKRRHDAALLSATDPEEALRLHELASEAAKKLAEQEERWLAIQERLAADAG